MTITPMTLRPGLLVSLKTSVAGGVLYNRVDIEPEHVVDETRGTTEASWTTHRTVHDKTEYELAQKVRGKAQSIIRSVCTKTPNFGMLCPEAKRDQLDAAINDARRVVDEFNATATLTQVGVYVIVGRIAADDVEALRAINSEVRDLMLAMETGIKNCDVQAVRDAADKARQIGSMLTPAMQERVQVAIKVAREAARKIVKAGDQAAGAIDEATLRKIAEERTAFLDLDGEQEVAAPAEEEGRTLDLTPETDVAVADASNPFLDIELENHA